MEYRRASRAIITDEEGRVLLAKRAEGLCKGMWGLIGGKQDSGESPKQAVIREVREEAGLEFDGVLVAVVEDSVNKQRDVWLTSFFLGQAAGKLVLQEENTDARFFDSAELAGIDIAFEHYDVIISVLDQDRNYQTG